MAEQNTTMPPENPNSAESRNAFWGPQADSRGVTSTKPAPWYEVYNKDHFLLPQDRKMEAVHEAADRVTLLLAIIKDLENDILQNKGWIGFQENQIQMAQAEFEELSANKRNYPNVVEAIEAHYQAEIAEAKTSEEKTQAETTKKNSLFELYKQDLDWDLNIKQRLPQIISDAKFSIEEHEKEITRIQSLIQQYKKEIQQLEAVAAQAGVIAK